MDIDKIAEAIRNAAYNKGNVRTNDDPWRRMAEAAVAAMELPLSPGEAHLMDSGSDEMQWENEIHDGGT